jgi:FkbM family methyltransferase
MYDDWQMLVDADRSSLSHKSVSKFEPAKQEFVRKYLKKGDVFFDVGACEGFYTMLASSIVGDTGLVIAVEPNGANVNTIKINAKICKCENVVTVQVALGQEYGSGKLYAAEQVTQYSLIKSDRPGQYNYFKEVSITTLDDISATFGTPNFLKIDVEGSELDVLAGGLEIIKNPSLKYIAVDVHHKLGIPIQSVHDKLTENGFHIATMPGQYPREVFAIRKP